MKILIEVSNYSWGLLERANAANFSGQNFFPIIANYWQLSAVITSYEQLSAVKASYSQL